MWNTEVHAEVVDLGEELNPPPSPPPPFLLLWGLNAPLCYADTSN